MSMTAASTVHRIVKIEFNQKESNGTKWLVAEAEDKKGNRFEMTWFYDDEVELTFEEGFNGT